MPPLKPAKPSALRLALPSARDATSVEYQQELERWMHRQFENTIIEWKRGKEGRKEFSRDEFGGGMAMD